MIDLRDTIWQFVGVIISLITLFITIVIAIWQRRYPGLAYTVILLKRQFGASTDSVLVDIYHIGNESISASAFENPLRVILPPSAQINSVAVFDSNPTNLPVTLIIKDNTIEVAPLLLNPRDNFTLHISVSEIADIKERQVIVEGRIAGISRIKSNSDHQLRNFLFFIPVTLINGIALFFAITGGIAPNSQEWWMITVVGSVSQVLEVVLIILIVVAGWRKNMLGIRGREASL